MPLRAFRLLAFPTISEASSLSFASTLELAAGQAWTRRVIAHSLARTARKCGLRTSAQAQAACSSSNGVGESHASTASMTPPLNFVKRNPKPTVGTDLSHHSFVQSTKLHTKANHPSFNWREALQGTPRTLLSPPEANRTTSKSQKSKERSDLVKVSSTDVTDGAGVPVVATTLPNGHTTASSIHELPPGTSKEALPSVNAYSPQDQSQSVPPPENPNSLYRNLLRLVNDRKPTTSLPSLVDYHGKYPQFQSTRSYNLLLDLSLRHQKYGIFQLLFRSVDRYCIPHDIETHRLMIECLIKQGLWNEAWVYFDNLHKRGLLPMDEQGRQGIPFPIWVTFFRISRKRRKPVPNDHSKLEYDDAVKTLQERYHFLQGLSPTDLPPLSATHPFAIFCLVDLMVKARERVAAATLAKAYFAALPRPMPPNFVFVCLKIIHTLMMAKVKPGLPGYYDARKRLFIFLKLHPSLRPNSKTLLLLFNMLEKAKRCGTVAWRDLIQFRLEFGPQVASRGVLRRVSQLALKERRWDITKLIRDSEWMASRRRSTRHLEPPVVNCRRLPHRMIYSGCGREARLWVRHRAAIRSKLRKLLHSSPVIIKEA